MRPEQEREYVEYVSGRLARLHRTAYLLCGDTHRAEDLPMTGPAEVPEPGILDSGPLAGQR
jgi:hypothetical protein